ncbi:HAD-IIB family hydrolase [Pseudaestuariivita sp.]|uniref:HAD-IIB family hydrolase n=1 Tax=Pseudaestuariivita sp. TaxID=2211669 RepID=UPI004058EEEB
MTALETTADAAHRFYLATDLDGTFLGGTPEARERLYNWIEDNRQSVGLIFVTGRDPGFIHELCDLYGLPMPEYVIGDVGTTIARVVDDVILPMHALEAEIAKAWDNAGPKVKGALAHIPGLKPQKGLFRYRMSFHMDPVTFEVHRDRVIDTVTQMGLDCLVSDDQFVDVLPRGVSKGPSLLRLLKHLGVPHGNVLTAGDTLNDLSMLTLQTPSVAVGLSEPALIPALKDAPRTHFAEAPGAAGIAEAIRAFDLHPNPLRS